MQLELAVDYHGIHADAMRVPCYKGSTNSKLNDNGTQPVDAAHKLREMIKRWDAKLLEELSTQKGMKYQFATPRV